MKRNSYGFIGLGLIGGSIAKAIRKIQPDCHILVYDTNTNMTQNALTEGIADAVTDSIGNDFHSCDMIFLCAPVSINNENLAQLKPYLSQDTLITDVGSVKSSIHDKVKELGLEKHFIGGHPMAGSEKSGFTNANPIILENAFYILTPTESSSEEDLTFYRELVQAIGAIPLVITCDKHDYVTAAISHVPHLIAAALVNLVHDHDTQEGTMKLVAAGGFKDITRIASSSPQMWEAICMTNSSNIADLLDDYIESLKDISQAVRSRQQGYTYDLFKESKEYRDSFANQSRGPIKKVFGCYLDIPDEAGAIATIATLLAKADISIKNIGIVHNREFEEGVLQVEFYEQASLNEAIILLQDLNYTVYERK